MAETENNAPLLQATVVKVKRKLADCVRLIPEKRRSAFLTLTVAAVFLILAIIFELTIPAQSDDVREKYERKHQVGLGLYYGVILALAELLRRCCEFGEEYRDLSSLYDNKIINLWVKTFTVDLLTSGSVLFNLTAVIIYCSIYPSLFQEIFHSHLVSSALTITAYLIYFGVFRGNINPVDVDRNTDNHPAMPGPGLACGHFMGYLKLLFLDDTKKDSEENNIGQDLDKQIEKYEEETGIKLSSKKIFEIVPDSCTAPDNDIKNYGLEPLEKKLIVTRIRGGFAAHYPVTVCKFKYNETFYYVMVDIPRTLSTLKDLIEDGEQLFSLTENQLASQVQQFAKKLKKLIKAKNLHSRIELIPFKDEDVTDASNCEIPDIIYDRLHRERSANPAALS